MIAAIVADALVFYTGAEFFAAAYEPGFRDAVNAMSFALVALVGYGHLRFINRYPASPFWRNVWLVAIPLVTIYGVLRLEFSGDFEIWNFEWATDFLRDSEGRTVDHGRSLVGALMLVGLWARSAWRAGAETDLEVLPKTLAIPFAIVTALLVAGALTERVGEIGRAGLAFYAVGIFSLALSQLALSGTSIGGLRIGQVTGTLFAGVVVSIAVAVVILTLAFGIFAPVLGPPIAFAVTGVLTIVMLPLVVVLDWVINLLLPGGLEIPSFDNLDFVPESTEGIEGGSAAGGDSAAKNFLKVALRLFALGLLVGIVAAATALVVRLRRDDDDEPADADVSPISSDLDDTTGWLRSLLPSWSRQRRKPVSGTGIIALYRQVLRSSDARGHPKPDGYTPRQFAPDLSRVFRDGGTNEITDSFEEAHYGGRDPDEETVEELRRRWTDSL
ncbi:MAG TPA: DUF4129 domain-containing protein [Dehalococcoidia bacterium]|nr:DUF4129 domain-containing protein [Dehalococcoidia bacterium]